MNVDLVVVADCPHAGPAGGLLRRALDDIGLAAVPFTTTVIDSLEQAETRRFLGSPTIMVDGADVFPEPGHPPGLTCRLYPRPDRTSTGLPDLRELRRSLKRVAAAAPSAQAH